LTQTPGGSPTVEDWWPHLRRFTLLSVLIAAEFTVVYYGADWITAHHALRIHAYGTSELRIPLVPVMVVPYMTMYVIFLFAPFVLRSTADLDRFAAALARVIVIAGVAFVLLPAQPGFTPVSTTASIWDPWLRLASALSRTYNLVPSLHVALFTVAAATYASRVSMWLCVMLGTWLVIVAASTVLTHQHHLIDVVAGLLLGGWGARVATAGSMPPLARRRSPSAFGHEGSRCSP
jgi:membrane-associated phospholipid phosphatase